MLTFSEPFVGTPAWISGAKEAGDCVRDRSLRLRLQNLMLATDPLMTQRRLVVKGSECFVLLTNSAQLPPLVMNSFLNVEPRQFLCSGDNSSFRPRKEKKLFGSPFRQFRRIVSEDTSLYGQLRKWINYISSVSRNFKKLFQIFIR